MTRRQVLAGFSFAPFSPLCLKADPSTPSLTVLAEDHMLSRESARAFRGFATDLVVERATLLLPGCKQISLTDALRTRNMMRSGGLAVWECGLSFANNEEIAAQRRVLTDVFDIHLGRGITQSTDSGHYIAFHCSAEGLLRPFGSTFPISGGDCRPVAAYSGRTVAVRKRIGRGELIVLGAMLGPHLLAGDPDAEHAFRYCLSSGL